MCFNLIINQFPVCADDTELLKKMYTIKKNKESLLDQNKEVGAELNGLKYVLMAHCQYAGQNCSVC